MNNAKWIQKFVFIYLHAHIHIIITIKEKEEIKRDDAWKLKRA